MSQKRFSARQQLLKLTTYELDASSPARFLSTTYEISAFRTCEVFFHHIRVRCIQDMQGALSHYTSSIHLGLARCLSTSFELDALRTCKAPFHHVRVCCFCDQPRVQLPYTIPMHLRIARCLSTSFELNAFRTCHVPCQSIPCLRPNSASCQLFFVITSHFTYLSTWIKEFKLVLNYEKQ